MAENVLVDEREKALLAQTMDGMAMHVGARASLGNDSSAGSDLTPHWRLTELLRKNNWTALAAW